MGYTVKCPNCQEINSGSQLYCTKCQTSLIGLSREHDRLSQLGGDRISEPVSKVIYQDNDKRSIKIGLLVGGVGFFISFGISFVFGVCGGLLAMIFMGAIAGFFAAQNIKGVTREQVSRLGSIAGGITGVFVLFGQALGGSILPMLLGMIGTLGGDANLAEFSRELFSVVADQSFCLGLIGIAVAPIAGGIATIASSDI